MAGEDNGKTTDKAHALANGSGSTDVDALARGSRSTNALEGHDTSSSVNALARKQQQQQQQWQERPRAGTQQQDGAGQLCSKRPRLRRSNARFFDDVVPDTE